MSALLQVQEASFGFEGGPLVFENVSAGVERGRITAVVGPNGAGKSTLLRTMAGLLRPSSGRVLLGGRPLDQLPARERARRIAFLPQTITPAFNLTVFEVVCLGRYPHMGAFSSLGPQDRAVAARCLKDTETESLRNRDFMNLSGGERQRVLLASVLAQEPEILLLDEPTSSLDLHHANEVMVLLERLRESGYAIAVVTHDLNLAARYCDDLLLLSRVQEGLLAHGAPEAVLTEELLSEAYAAPIRVCAHPLTGAPLVTAVVDAAQAQCS
jgi:iron complex transport system ATP-binding protein